MLSKRIILVASALVMCLALAGQAQDPGMASAPSPGDAAQWVKTEGIVLTWTVGVDAILHNVYFSTDQAAVEARDASASLRQMSLATEIELEALDIATTYYWAVDEWSATGETFAGDVWSFTTYDPAVGGAVAEYWSNMSYDGDPDVVTTVGEVNFDFGSADVPGENSPDAAIPVDGFSCRWSAELAIPTTGAYTFYSASDDGGRLFLNGEQITDGWYDRGTTEDASEAIELVAGERYLLVMEMYENGGGASAYLRWEGPGIAKQIIPQGALQIPQVAFSVSPASGAEKIESTPLLSWSAGEMAVAHDVYLGTDADLVAAGDASTYLGRLEATSIQIEDALMGDTTYYWKVDEVAADESIVAGIIWNFTVIPDVLTSPEGWAGIVALANPTFFATDVVDGVYDIGVLAGEITYEFTVKSNPLETQASMALIGRRNFGDTQVGLKYEQWNNTGTYGATVFGVADYDYGVATDPGVPTHLVFVSSEEAGTTALYVNGVYQASIDSAITLSGLVGIGFGAQAEDGSDYFDDFDGEISGVAIYDMALTSGEIKIHSNAYFMTGVADVTSAADVVIGEPNDGDWPGAETPNLAVDDNVSTKFLHFKGETEATGIKVAPAVGATVVRGLTFTTANDAPERDPVAFELYGSNESIEGPFELIAAGDIVDFAGEEAWPRFTMTATPIEIANDIPYLYYQVMVTAVRDAASANSMQVAEIELIGQPAVTLWAEDFEAYAAGTDLHGVNGWKGWDNTAGAAAPVSDAMAVSGTNSVEILGSSDLVHEFDVAGGVIEFCAMQFIPSGTTGTTYFILLNSYDDGANQDWSIQTTFNLDSGAVGYWGGSAATIVYDEWVEVKYVIDLSGNSVDKYYNGELIETAQWDDTEHDTLGAIDLYGNGASSVYYDDITIATR